MVKAVVLASVLSAVHANPVMFTTVVKSSDSAVDDAREVTVRTAGEWRALWKQHAATTAPAIDFAKEMVVGVFLGSRPTGGYTVEIVSVESTDAEMVVTYREAQPSPTTIVTQALTSPVHLVRMPRTTKSIRFARTR